MNCIVSWEAENLISISKRLELEKSSLSSIFYDGMLAYVLSEINSVISTLNNEIFDKNGKKIRVAREFGAIKGIEKTLGFLKPAKESELFPYFFYSQLFEIENSLGRILMNL